MSIGEKRQRVVFQRPTETPNAFGEPVQTWADLCTSWALVQPLRGAERFSANQVQSDVDVRIVTRYRPELSSLRPKDRALWKSRSFDIKAVINKDSRDREYEILAREYV